MDILSYVIGKSAGEAAAHVDIEQLDVTENNTYTAQSGHAYSPVVVNVPQTTIEALNVTSDGTYTAPEGKAYSPISVSVSDFDLPALLDGTLTSIESGTTSLRNYAFYYNAGLQSASFPNAASVGTYAFYHCDNLVSVSLPLITELPTACFSYCQYLSSYDFSNVTSIGGSVFQGCDRLNIGTLSVPSIGGAAFYNSTGVSTAFTYSPSVAATVGARAFNWSGLSRIEGKFSSIGNEAFRQCDKLSYIDMELDGTFGNNVFQDTYKALKTVKLKINGNFGGENNFMYVTSFYFDPESNITNLSSSRGFYSLGSNRPSPSSNIFELDLRNSTFPAIPNYTFDSCSYVNIKLPSTVISMPQCFRSVSNCNVYFSSQTPPSINSTGWITGTYNVFVPYFSLNKYKTATNWTQISSNITGYAYEGTFEEGETLPLYDNDGYVLTWYSDLAKTNAVVTCPAGSPELYCVSGAKATYVISGVSDETTTLTITDTEGDTYHSLPAFIPFNRGVIINATPPAGGTNATKVNNTIVSVPYVISLLDSDINLTSKSVEGTIPQETLENSTWENIKKVGYLGVAEQYWNVGDTKSVTLSDSSTYTVRIANLSGQSYAYSDGSGSTSFIMEFVKCIPPGRKMNTSGSTNTGGWPQCNVRTAGMPAIMELLPVDLLSAISEVKVWSYSSSWVESSDKLFLPVEKEVSSSKVYSDTAEWNAFTKWQYYSQHPGSSDRIKLENNTAATWWLRTTYSNSYYVVVVTNGAVSSGSANTSYSISPCFCI